MRPHFFFIVLFFFTAALVGHVVTKNDGPHNGVVKRVDNYCIEMKNVEKKLFAYLLDKKLHTISNRDLTAEAVFSFPDSTSMSMSLKPDVDDAFTCEAPSDFYACKININRQGKVISAIFPNTLKVVRK
jgi:hypothetical protein